MAGFPLRSSAKYHTLAAVSPTYERLVERMLKQLNMGHGLDELLASVFDHLSGVVPSNRIAVALLEEPAHVLRLVACRSDGEVKLKIGYAARVEGSTLAPLLETGAPRIISDLDEYLRQKPTSSSTELIVREGMKSSLTLPLLADGKPIGVIFFSSRQKDRYTDQHAELLGRLASPIAIGVEKTRLIGQLQQTNEELARANSAKDDFLDTLRKEVDKQTEQLRRSESRYRLLVEMGQVVNSSLDVRQVFRHAATQIHKQLGCDRVSLLLVAGRATSRHGFAIEFNGDRSHWAEIPTQPLPGSAFDWVMQHRVPQVVRSLKQAQSFPEDRRLFEVGYGSKVYLPLLSREQSVGVLGIVSRRENQPDHWDLELLREICAQLSIALDNASAYSEIDRLKSELEQQNVYLRDEIRTDNDFGSIIGDSPAMRQVRVAVEQVALTDSTVLILGETGTGKELIARAIHDASSRRDNLMVKVNCASLAPSLIASELFGHEAGAFTGATELRRGRFELSHHGSIFLDEISEVPAETQVMLLRVLQERVIERVGGSEPIDIDTRVIAASNRNLKTAAEEGRFREDLYYRLNVFPIVVPPLRERREDIPALLNHFIGRFSARMNKSITRVDRRGMEVLMQYDWPGNVRELENIIERSMIISRGDTLSLDSSWLSGNGALSGNEPQDTHSFGGMSLVGDADVVGFGAAPRSDATLAEIERGAILDTLDRCGGKVYGHDGAAVALGLKPTTLYGKMRKHRIKSSRQHE
ncbi:sigma 54-interacting transcriptional regulator [Rhodopirellula sp. ICT_H3.1]|uniref:Sigma 54-interacting transcriptional regulator n=1 Tax=Aporhodopirellula aestuarii TaxID=2950107 RepID=A0ABT0U5T5_9BACT|nr:sigma 54-interacting transcriptional regulator [Aporhodopirellula aestuarii]